MGTLPFYRHQGRAGLCFCIVYYDFLRFTLPCRQTIIPTTSRPRWSRISYYTPTNMESEILPISSTSGDGVDVALILPKYYIVAFSPQIYGNQMSLHEAFLIWTAHMQVVLWNSLLIYTAGSQKLNDYENSNSLTAYHRIALGLREVSDISQLGSDLGPFVLR